MAGLELDVEPFGRVEVHPHYIAIKVSRRPLKGLALPLVVVHPDHVPIRTVKFRIEVHHALDEIVAGREIGEALYRRAQVCSVDDPELTRRQPLYITSEKWCSVPPNLESGFPFVCSGNHDEDTPSHWASMGRRRIGNPELGTDLGLSGTGLGCHSQKAKNGEKETIHRGPEKPRSLQRGMEKTKGVEMIHSWLSTVCGTWSG